MIKKLILKNKCLVLKRLLRIAYSAKPNKHAYVCFSAFTEDGVISCHEALEMLRGLASKKLIKVSRIYINDADGRSEVNLMRKLANELSFKMTQTTIDSVGYRPKNSDQIEFEVDCDLAEAFLKKHDTSYSYIDLGFVETKYKGLKLGDDNTLYLGGHDPVVLSPMKAKYVKSLLQAWPEEIMPSQFKLFSGKRTPGYFTNLRGKLIKYLVDKSDKSESFFKNIFGLDKSKHVLK